MLNSANGTIPEQRVSCCGRTFLMLLALNLFVPRSTYGDDTPGEAYREAIRQMSEQIQELQARVKELEARLNAEAAGTSVQTMESRAPATTHSNGAQPTPTPPTPA